MITVLANPSNVFMFYHRILLHLISTTKGRIEVVHVKFQEICYLDFGQVVPVLYSGLLGTSIYAGLGTQTMCPITNNQISKDKTFITIVSKHYKACNFSISLSLKAFSIIFMLYLFQPVFQSKSIKTIYFG